MKPMWMNMLAWVAAVVAALTLSLAAPNESSIMGRLPTPSMLALRMDRQQTVAVPQDLPADRVLALVSFHKGHRKDIESWINGLQLRGGGSNNNSNAAIPWVRMPVLEDPGNAAGRSALENHLLARHPAGSDRANLVPVLTDRAAFMRSAGLGSTERMYALVINRRGEVLARVEGQYDADKAHALRETLAERGL